MRTGRPKFLEVNRPTCGGTPFGQGTRPDGKASAAINVRCLKGIDLATLKVVPFDGRSL